MLFEQIGVNLTVYLISFKHFLDVGAVLKQKNLPQLIEW